MGTFLIFLVGTNPLPIWVASQHLNRLLSNVSRITLIHTSSTKTLAENLKKKMEEAFPNINSASIKNIPTSSSDPAEIITTINTNLEDIPDIDHVHLHYTGGTKVMAVHSYHQAISTPSVIKNSIKFSASYLDPREDKKPKLVFDGNMANINISDIAFKDAREKIKTDLNDLCDLHGYTAINIEKNPGRDISSKEEASSPAARLIFDEIIKNPIIEGAYIDWAEKKWMSLFDEKGNLNKKVDEIIVPAPEFSDKKGFQTFPGWEKIIENIVNEGLTCNKNVFLEKGQCHPFNTCGMDKSEKVLRKLDKFFCGKFLEHIAYDELFVALKNISNSENWSLYHSINFEPLIIDKTTKNTNFEIDVMAILGYQLLCISCTTDDNRARVKLKGFEILHRARQIGGDEARVILLSRLPEGKDTELENDLHKDIGSEDRPLTVWGRDKWTNLQCYFANYLQTKMEWS